MADGGSPNDTGIGSLTPAPPGLLFIAAIGVMMMIAPLSIDMYLPTFPTLAAEFDARPGDVQLTLALFLISFAVAQPVWGVITDRFGRRRPLVVGLLLYSAASVLCARATSIEALVVARVLQALTAAAGPVTASALIRDAHGGPAGARIRSMVGLVSAWAPMAAPLVGGQILRFFDWPGIFLTLGLFGLVPLVYLPFLTVRQRPAIHRRTERLSLGASFGLILGNRRFLGYACQNSLQTGGLFAFITASPFVYIGYFGISPQWYGLLMCVNVASIMASGFVNIRLVGRRGIDSMLAIAATMSLACGSLLLVTTTGGWFGVAGVVVPASIGFFAAGLTFANAFSGATESFPDHAGLASGLMGSLGMATGAVAGGIVGQLDRWTPPVALGISLFSFLGGVFLVNRFVLGGRLARPD